jgi:hypothetical protein
VWPIGVYSVCELPVLIDLTTTSPVFTPALTWIGGRSLLRRPRADEDEDAIASGLDDIAIVAVYRLDH